MPEYPGVLQLVEVDPAVAYQGNDRNQLPGAAYIVSSQTWNPPYGLEAGRSAELPAPTADTPPFAG